MKNSLLLLLLIPSMLINAQALSMRWQLVQNDAEPGVVESIITLTNNSSATLTSDGDWLIGYCWASVHPYTYEGAELEDTMVCATYHQLRPTAAFRPLAPGESREYKLLQRGGILRQTGGPEGAFFVAGNGAKPMDVSITTEPFSSKTQFMRKNNPGYADGEWMYAYNAPFCKELSAEQEAMRQWQLIPYPKEIKTERGKVDLKKVKMELKQVADLPEEGYRIHITHKRVIIESTNVAGYRYALITLEQLGRSGEKVPCMQITDYPDLQHRGLMLDIVRNYLGKEEVIRILNQMVRYKMNVLHFHIADDEAWRVEINGLPELTEMGSRRGYTTDEHECLYPAYCGGWDAEAKSVANGFLSERDYIDIVHHADQLGIQVIPEIDMPGHSRAAIRAMEERYRRLLPISEEEAWRYRLADPNDTSRYSSAQYYTDDVICIALPSSYTFVEKVMTELARMHREAGQPLKVFHVGGDEVAKGAWEGSPVCQRFMQENGLNTHELKDRFLIQLYAMAQALGIESLGGWEEVAMRGGEVNADMANRVDVISWCWNSIPEWRGDEKPYKLANAGYKVVLACVGNNYLDMSYTHHHEERGLHWGGYTDEHSTFDFLPYDIYRSVRYTMKREQRDIEAYDKAKTIRLKHNNIYGINGQLFAETLRSTDQLEDYIFPKLYGLAERGWNATPISYRMAEGSNQEERLRMGRELFETERLLFSQQVFAELKYLNMPNNAPYSFHLAQPGIHVENGMVTMNHPCREAIIRYTTDGSTPTAESPVYTKPFELQGEADGLRAKAFYLGKESATTWY